MVLCTYPQTNKSISEIAVRPFIEAFDGELCRLESDRNTIFSSAEALLEDADGLSRRNEHGKLRDTYLKQEVDFLRKQAKDLQRKTITMINETNNTQKELPRIALRANPKDPSEGKDEFS